MYMYMYMYVYVYVDVYVYVYVYICIQCPVHCLYNTVFTLILKLRLWIQKLCFGVDACNGIF